MSESIIPGTAVIGASFSVVVFIAHKAIGVFEFSSAAAVQILRPLFSDCQVSLGGKAADEALRVFWQWDKARYINDHIASSCRDPFLSNPNNLKRILQITSLINIYIINNKLLKMALCIWELCQ